MTHVVVLADTHIRRSGTRKLPDAAYAHLDLPETQHLVIDGVRIAMVHDSGPGSGPSPAHAPALP